MITCAECGEILPDIVDGDLTSEQARALLAQAENRPRCQGCIEVYCKTAKICREVLQKAPLPAGDRDSDGERLLTFLRDTLHADK